MHVTCLLQQVGWLGDKRIDLHPIKDQFSQLTLAEVNNGILTKYSYLCNQL
jgi:hypothetical protein